MNQQTIMVISAVVDEHRLKLYQPNGETIEIMQGDPRVQKILDVITVPLSQHPGVPVAVSLDEIALENNYSKLEEKTNGVVKFFRVAKSALKKFFGVVEAPHVDPIALGAMPEAAPVSIPAEAPLTELDITLNEKVDELTAVLDQVAEKKTEALVADATPAVDPVVARNQAALADIMKHAIPAAHPNFDPKSTHNTNSDDTLVAMVGDELIPNAQNLSNQVKHSVESGDAAGLQKFLERLATVKRSHSKEDLMKFMQRGDLPIADDGSIIAYKILRTGPNGKWVDCHSGNVLQGLGSYVCMDESLVDHNRNNECSNGLHVARRQYLGGFGGNIMVLIKVAPEDVIAVPQYDANKMRVCGYHILFQISEEDAKTLKANQPMTNNRAAAQLLNRAMRGDHAAPIEEVRIGGAKGADLKITKLGERSQDVATVTGEAQAFEDPDAIDSTVVAPTVAPLEVSKAVEAIRAPETVEPVEVPVLSRAEQAKLLSIRMDNMEITELERKEVATQLRALKKSSKVGWDKLGLNANTSQLIAYVLGETAPEPATQVKPVKAGKFKAVATQASVKMGPAARIAELMPDAMNDDAAVIEEIRLIKREAKKSWTALGVTDEQVRKLTAE